MSAVLGLLLLTIICALPCGRVSAHVRESGEILAQEGDRWQVIPAEQSASLDNFTDCIMLLTSAYAGDESALSEAVMDYRVYKKDASKAESCMAAGTLTKEEGSVLNYPWYWHGYKIILKPLLFFFNLGEIRQLNALLIIGWISLISILMSRHHMKLYIVPYLMGIAFLNLSAVIQSLQFSTIFHVTSFFCVLLLAGTCSKKMRDKSWLLFLAAGICTSYFDFLTYPVMVLGFLLVIYIGLMGVYGKYSIQSVWRVIENSILWGCGYLGMWAMKWVLGTLLSDQNVLAKAYEQIVLRSGQTIGDTAFTVGEMYRMLGTYVSSNPVRFLIPLYLLTVAVLLIWLDRKSNIFVGAHTKKTDSKKYNRNLRQRWIGVMLLLVVSLYPLIWYYGAKNHSYQHNFFTFRSMAVCFFAGGSLLNPLWRNVFIKNKKSV